MDGGMDGCSTHWHAWTERTESLASCTVINLIDSAIILTHRYIYCLGLHGIEQHRWRYIPSEAVYLLTGKT